MRSIDCVCSSWERAAERQRSDKLGNHSPEGVIIEQKTNDGIGIQEWVICCPPLGHMRTQLPSAFHNLELHTSVRSGPRRVQGRESTGIMGANSCKMNTKAAGGEKMKGTLVITNAGSAICDL